jgi:hypothetical protein
MNIFLVMGCMGSPEVGSGASEPFSLWEIKIMKGFPVIEILPVNPNMIINE